VCRDASRFESGNHPAHPPFAARKCSACDRVVDKDCVFQKKAGCDGRCVVETRPGKARQARREIRKSA
jgi:hypothetical protein